MSWKSFWKGVGNFGLGLLKSIPVVGNVVGAIENAVTAGKPKNLEDSSSSGWASTLSGAIPGLVDAGTTMLVNNVSKRGDINAQKELMSYQNTLQGQNYERELADKKELIADDRAYNDIGSQMARAEQAGVSPLAALGVSSGNSISAQAPSHGGVSGHHVANNLLATISTLKGLQMQKELNDAQVYRTRQAGKLDEAKAETEKYNTVMSQIRAANLTEREKAEIDEILSRKGANAALEALNKAKTQTEDDLRDVLKRLNEAKVSLTNEQSRNEFAKTLINAFEASYLSRHGEYPSRTATDRLIDSIRHALIGDKEDYDKFMNWDAGILGEILSKIMGYINEDSYPDFVRWLDMMRSRIRK